MPATDPVQAVAEALIAHTRLSMDGRCSCGHVVPLGYSVVEHQAEAAVAAARPAIEREAKAAALREARDAIRDRRRHMDQYGADEQYAQALHDAWGLVFNLLRDIEREGQP